MNLILWALLFFYFSLPTAAQELYWHSLNGPMGGIIGGVDIDSNGNIYAGSYAFIYGYAGLFKSTDNGNSWNKIETQFNDFAVYCIYITKTGNIWIGTDHQGLYRSTDDGSTWEKKDNGFYAGECWAIGQSNDDVLFAGDGDGGQLYRSADNGDNWELASSIAPLSFAVDSNNIVYTGTFNGLYLSTDNGLTWIQNTNLPAIVISSVIIDKNNNIYCGTGYYDNGNGVYYSTDGGQNWPQIGLEGKVVLSLAFDTKGNLYAGTLSDGLFSTSDFGQSWKQNQNGIYKKEVYRLKINSQDDIFFGSEGGGNGWYFYGGGGVFKSTDSGNSFKQVGLPISMVRNTVFCGDSLIFTSTPSGIQSYNILTKKWQNLGLHDVEAVTITPSDYLYAATREEGLYKSTDLGKCWTLTNLTVDTLMSVYNVFAVNDDTLFASTQYNLRRSTNGGENWNVLPIKTGDGARGLFYNDNILWLIGISASSLVLYKTYNLGSSFDSLYAGFDTFDLNNSISAINNEYIYLASRSSTFNGIIRSTDIGMSWEQILNKQTIPSIFSNTNGLVITSSDSILISNDYGVNWINLVQPIGTGIGDYITDIKQNFDDKFFFGTSTKGLFKVDIITSVENTNENSTKFYLSQNYPNPFNPSTRINYNIPGQSPFNKGGSGGNRGRFVTLKVYDVLGKEIVTLVNAEKSAGSYEVNFDGSKLSSGVYFYQLKAGDFIESKKMLLLK